MGRLGRMFSRFRSTRAGSESQPEKPEELREMRWVVAGLGNPGEQYHRSGHNIGFTVIDRLAEKCGARLDRRKFKGIFGEVGNTNYERAVELARGFQGEAPRANATIAIARSVLNEKSAPVPTPQPATKN